MKGIKVLLVDDEIFALKILARKISPGNFDVVTAEDGLSAIEKVNKESPDVIVMDLEMPKMDGYEVLEHLRMNVPEKQWTPVLFVTGHPKDEPINKNRIFKPDYYMTKPCQSDQIINCINQFAELHTERTEG